MSLFKYPLLLRSVNKLVLHRQILLHVQKCSTATVLESKQLSFTKLKAIKNEDHFIISDETTGGQIEVTFAWLRDHCRSI